MKSRTVIIAVGGAIILAAVVWVAWVANWSANAKPGKAIDYVAKVRELAAEQQKDDTREGDAFAALKRAVRMAEQVTRPFERGASRDLEAALAGVARTETMKRRRGEPLAMREIFWLGEDPRGPGRKAWRTAEERVVDRLDVIAREAAMRAFEGLREAGLDAIVDEMAASRPGVMTVHGIFAGADEWDGDVALRTFDLSRYNGARVRDAVTRGDWAEVVRAFDGMLALPATLAYQPELLLQSVSRGDYTAANQVLAQMIGRVAAGGAKIPADTLDVLVEVVERRSRIPPITYLLECERLMAMDAVQATHTDDGRGNGRMLPSMIKGHRMPYVNATVPGGVIGGVVTRLVLVDKKTVVARTNEIFDLAVRQMGMSNAERSTQATNPETLIKSLPFSEVSARFSLHAWDRRLLIQQERDLAIAGMRTLLALERCRAERGEYPTALEELVPRYLAAMPIDPYSTDSRTPLRYARLAAVAEGGGARPQVLLYSVGPDGIDHGGRGLSGAWWLKVQEKSGVSEHDIVLGPRDASGRGER